ncbi:MAG: ABC transporter permease [Cyclobacteriaceae bacterium]
MIKNYFKIAYRNFIRNKTYSLINTLGLALSMFCAMLIILWIHDELSYETFWPNADQLYRVAQEHPMGDAGVFRATATPAPLPEFIQEQSSDVLEFTRFRPVLDPMLIQYGENHFNELVTFVDSTFFTVFPCPFLMGDPDKALLDPNSMVITARVAEKYFGADWQRQEVLGQTVLLDKGHTFSISGVIENLPSNTHFQFDILFPFRKLYQLEWDTSWDNSYYYTYFLLRAGADPDVLNQQMTRLLNEREFMGGRGTFYLQAVKDIHLHSNFDIDVYSSTEPRAPYVTIFIVVAIAIILIACINFMNLSTAQSERRAKEIGLRKAIGSRRWQIVGQLLSESVLITMLALLIAGIGVVLILPYFNQVVDKSIVLGSGQWSIGLAFVMGAMLVGLMAGSYPALFLSQFKPVQVLKGGFKAQGGGTLLRRILVVTQFAVTIILILGTAVVYQQFRYFMEKDLGYDKERLVYIPIRGQVVSHLESLKNELRQQPSIANATIASDIPTYTIHATYGADWDGKDEEALILLHHYAVDYDFLETLGLQLVDGRNFSPDNPADSASFILNEEAVRVTGLEDPIGQRFSMIGNEGKIIGVVKDFNFKSLHQKVEPLVLRISPPWKEYVMVKLTPGNPTEALAQLESSWKKYESDYPFEYHFMDEQYEALYSSEKRMAEIFDYFTLFTLFIACLGLIGLINHMIEKRRKEVSIRKVLGASVSSILLLLSQEYMRLILLAFVISIPIANYFIGDWLENFAYSVEVPWWLYIAPGLLVLLIALLSVSGQTLQAARKNPVDNLRYE